MMVPDSEVPKKTVGMLVTGAEVFKNLADTIESKFFTANQRSKDCTPSNQRSFNYMTRVLTYLLQASKCWRAKYFLSMAEKKREEKTC